MQNKRNQNEWVISYFTLRRAVGILGIALPTVLFIGFSLFKSTCELPPSISHYYYTGFSSYFTGTLCTVALFLFSYKGPEDKDRNAALVACACALGVAFFPTNPYCSACDNCIIVHLGSSCIRNILHYTFATVLFLTFSYFCFFLFTKTNPGVAPTTQKRIRNKIFICCGWTIIGCIAIIGLTSIPAIAAIGFVKDFTVLTFVFEAIALFAFGYSWLIKGDTFFKDKK